MPIINFIGLNPKSYQLEGEPVEYYYEQLRKADVVKLKSGFGRAMAYIRMDILHLH